MFDFLLDLYCWSIACERYISYCAILGYFIVLALVRLQKALHLDNRESFLGRLDDTVLSESIDNPVDTLAKHFDLGILFARLVGFENPLAISRGCYHACVLVEQVVEKGGKYCGNCRVVWHAWHSDKVSVEDDIADSGELCGGGVVVVSCHEAFES